MMGVNNDLIQAVREGNLPEATVLIDGQSDSSGLSGGYPLLRLAVEMNHSAIVRLLLDRGCPVSTSAPVSESLLHIAVRNGNIAILAMLLKEGADVNQKNKSGETPMAVAVRQRCLPMIELLLQYEEATEAVPHDGALHLAARNGFFEIVDLILDKGADANKKNMAGQTPLHIAVGRGHFPTVQLLLKCGADVNAKDDDGRTALHFTSFDKCEGGRLIPTYETYYYACHDSLNERDMYSSIEDEVDGLIKSEIAQLLLSTGAHVDAQTKHGYTALHFSVTRRFNSLVDLLLRYNADVNIANNYGYTALSISVKNGYKDLCSVLLNKGADITDHGYPPLNLAVRCKNQEMVELLLQNGALVNRTDESGRTALSYARDLRLMQTLLDFGANADCRGFEDGLAALHSLSQEGNERAIALLLEYGADINIRTKICHTWCDKSYTALDWVHYNPHANFPVGDGDANAAARDVLLRHQAKMEAIGLHVEKSQFSDRYEETVKELRESYQEEVKNLKSEFINGSTASYYDVLTKDVTCLARYLDNENVEQAAESEEYRGKFPAYASMIKCQFRKASAKNKLLKSASQVLNGLVVLPEVCARKILEMLSDDDLAVLGKLRN